MADEFSTPISSLGMETTRSQDKSTVQAQSYEELLRQQNDPPEPAQKKVRFRDPPAEEYDDRYMDTQRPTHDYMTGPPMQWQQQMQPMQQQMYAPLPPPPPQAQTETDSEKEKKPWWKVWITQNKVGMIAAIVIFALLYFVYPRISALERFMGQRLPTSIVAGMSIIAASGVTAINMAI